MNQLLKQTSGTPDNGQHESPRKRPPIVVVVDDEEMVTKTVASFLQFETDYEIHTFESPLKALEGIKLTQPDVIISDFLMPEMDGLTFIKAVKRLYPETSSILLTGYADKENAIKAINEVGIFQYIEKPWDNDHLKVVIRNGLEQKDLKLQLQKKIKESDEMLLERDRLAQDNEMMKEELRLAQSVQMSMLPQNFPAVNGIAVSATYQPSLEIGGDFYDVIPLSKERIGILIADVTGHGIQSALITVLLKSAFSTFLNSDIEPGEILASMNRILYPILPKGFFVAAMAATIDTRSGECRLVNGGVPYPFHVRVKDKIIEKVPANGLLLGIADADLFKPGDEVRIDLRKGDRLLLYTDGISETENPDGEHFDSGGMQRILADTALRPAAVVFEQLTQSAKEFSRPGHHWDDITILSIERN
jgi:serine phosphatase RsbU (regulator of sigma subunit)